VCACFVDAIGFDGESKLESGEAEVAVRAFAAGAGAVDFEIAVGEAVAFGEAGEGDGEAGGGGGDEEVFGAPGGGVGAAEDGWRCDLHWLSVGPQPISD
jgi:hypothetical protein